MNMQKMKVFQVNRGADKAEAEVNNWLAQNSKVRIISTAGTNAYIIIFYEE